MSTDRNAGAEIQAQAVTDTQKMRHELQVQQTALEMQNAELEAREQEYRALFDRMLNGFAYCRMIFEGDRPLDFIYLKVNPAFEALTGLKDVVGKKATEVIPGIREANPQLFEIYGRVVLTGVPERFEMHLKALNQWFSVSVYCLRKEHFVAIFEITTERKRAEDALRASEVKYRAVTENVQLGIVAHAPDTTVQLSNPMASEILGLTPEQMRGKKAIDPAWCFIREDGTKMPVEEYPINRAVAEEMPIHGLVLGIIRPDRQSPTWVECDARKIWGPMGELEQVIVAFSDITEHKQAAEALRAREVEFQAMFEVASIGMAQADPRTGKWIRVNQKMCHITGYSQEEMLQLRVPEITHPEDRERDWQMFQEVVRGERPDYHIEKRYLRKNGAVIWVSVNMTIIRDAAGQPVRTMATIEDISERKLLEEQLRQSQKLESIGQLAGGIAHDYNNLLASTMMNLGMLQGNPNLDAEAKETLRELTVEAQRAANLTRQLLLFSRRSVMEVKVLDLNELVGNLLKMLGRLLGEHITIHFNCSHKLPLVKADPGMLEQVLMNLAVNARDAMPKGGRLSFSLQPMQVDAERIKGNVEVQPGLFICISVTDTGCGMAEAIQKRIFEPFFTTKEVGKGTGLGLATAYGIIAQHKGWIEVQSEAGKGSTFRVFLPATAQEHFAQVQNGMAAVQRGQETILLVEDDVVLRRVAARAMRSFGYRVLEAENGQAAIKQWQEQAGQIDLLFSDMVMPEGMTGLDLAERLRATKPALKVIITSGYNTEMVAQGRPTASGIRYLQKPYQIEMLSKVVRECLEGKEG